ncbi:Aminopeptidase 1 [Leucoagaricus sp. SymC.cos]|nr:Aminopeptidase 1 [Leucoagaricus sp. SymC.cos]
MPSFATQGAADEYRLPTNVKPTHYDITVKTNLEALTFTYYKSSYGKDGKTNHYTLTQFAVSYTRLLMNLVYLRVFKPTVARRAFPSWDEPLFKATHKLNLISRADTLNLSNMPPIFEEIITLGHKPVGKPGYVALFSNLRDGEWKVTKFHTTPRLMSTYIVEFTKTRFSLDLAKAVLPFYEKVFDVGYPLPKLDVLVATDFEAGLVESWGLIIGAPQMLLIDPTNADLRTQKRVARGLSHEIAHQWFGNITTLEWCQTYLYLHGGFATLVDTLFSFSQISSNFITTHLNQARSLDGKPSSHPIEVDCPDSNRINQIFDNLAFSKAVSVLRMLRFMDSWIKKIGFPVLSVTESPEGIIVRQDRFLETGKGRGADNETIWHVPLRILTVNSDGKAITDNEALLTERQQFFKLDTSKPYKSNAGTTGVYRVLYEPKTLAKIAEEATKDDFIFSLGDSMVRVGDYTLFTPPVEKPGYDNTADDFADTIMSRIPADLQRVIFSTVFNGGCAEHDTIAALYDKPKSPSARIAAIIKRFGGSFSVAYLFPFSFNVLSSEKDLKETEAFFRDKDISSYNLALNQSLDSIRTRI